MKKISPSTLKYRNPTTGKFQDFPYVVGANVEQLEQEVEQLKESKADQSNVYSKTESDGKYQVKGSYLTSFTETDPTVPAWAKKSTKPSYTASEVGADASGTAESKVSQHNASTTSHADIRSELSEYQSLTLGVHSDGKIYLFKNGSPVGSGVEAGSDGDVIGYIDSNKNIVLKGTLNEDVYIRSTSTKCSSIAM